MFNSISRKQTKNIPSLDKVIVAKMTIADIENLTGGKHPSPFEKMKMDTLTVITLTGTH